MWGIQILKEQIFAHVVVGAPLRCFCIIDRDTRNSSNTVHPKKPQWVHEKHERNQYIVIYPLGERWLTVWYLLESFCAFCVAYFWFSFFRFMEKFGLVTMIQSLFLA